MPIANFPTPKQSEFKKVEFIDLCQGQHTIRILQETAVVYDTHFVHGITFKCLGDDCPVCKNNIRIRSEHPNDKNPSLLPGYIAKRAVAYINVFDRTPVKVCTNCSKEVKKVNGLFPATCPKCNTIISTIKAAPLNKIKVLPKGKMFFDQVEFHNATAVDEETQTPLGVTNFDLSVMVIGGKNAPAVSPLLDRKDEIEFDEADLFDLTKAIIVLSSSEILDVVRGASLRDIFLARKEETQLEKEEQQVTEGTQKMMEEMASLFN